MTLNKIGLIAKVVLYRKIKLIIKKEEAKWSNTHKKKLDRFQSERRQHDKAQISSHRKYNA